MKKEREIVDRITPEPRKDLGITFALLIAIIITAVVAGAIFGGLAVYKYFVNLEEDRFPLTPPADLVPADPVPEPAAVIPDILPGSPLPSEPEPPAPVALPTGETLSYADPGNFEISYPSYWHLTATGEAQGYEIVTLRKIDPKAGPLGHGGPDPNGAMLKVSILDAEGRSVQEIANQDWQAGEAMVLERLEPVVIGGRTGVRAYGDAMGPAIYLYLDAGSGRYVLLTGWHGLGEQSDMLRQDLLEIHESFRLL